MCRALLLLALAAGASLVLAACNRSQAPAETLEEGAGRPTRPTTLPRSPAPTNARVYIVEPANGATVTSPFTVRFGAENLRVVAAGTVADDGGHHHLLIDVDLPDNLSLPIPSDDRYRHFGTGQTETTLSLTPGTHQLQLLLGDHVHVPHDPPVASPVVTITVR